MHLLFSLILMLSTTTAMADDATLSQVMAALAQVKTAQAAFTETKTLSVLNAPLQDSGTLSYTAPDHLEKLTISPAPESVVVDGKTLTVTKDGDTHTVDLGDYPEVSTFIESIRSTMAGNSAALNAIYTVAFTGTFDAWQIALQPKEPDMRDIVQSIRISGAKSTIRRVETVEANGDHTDMIITEAKP